MKFHFVKLIRESFGLRIFLIFTACIFLLVSAFTVFFFQYQSSALTQHLIQRGLLISKILAHSSKIGVFSENSALLTAPGEGILQQPDVYEVAIYNRQGKVLKSLKRTSPDSKKNDPQKTESQQQADALSPETVRAELPFYHNTPRAFIFFAPVLSGVTYEMEQAVPFPEISPPAPRDRVIGFVRVSMTKANLTEHLNKLLATSISIGMIFLIVIAPIIFFISKRMTQPLKKLTEGVKVIGTGGKVENIPVESSDEIGNLARAFNQMSESLKKREAENQNLEKQLHFVQKMEAIGTLAGGIAHDFNNILSAIMGYTELAMLEVSEESRLPKKLNEVFKASLRAKDLVNQILTFSRQAPQEPKPYKLALIIKEVLKMLRASIPSTIEIRQNIAADLSLVMTDPTHIHQVVMNLCTNAAHAMKEKGGQLEVRLEDVTIDAQEALLSTDLRPGKYQKLTVKDTGHGMQPDIIDRIFDPFFSTKPPGEGTGMGLSVVHGIIKNHNGAIVVYSQPDKGTTFDVYFPVMEVATPLKYEENTSEALPKGKNQKILLIDDEAMLTAVGQELLESLEYDVVSETSVHKALDIFRESPDKFEVIITDMTMPHINGIDFSAEIRKIRPSIPIILCTGYSDAVSESTAKSVGIQEILTKPLTRRQISDAVQKALRPKTLSGETSYHAGIS